MEAGLKLDIPKGGGLYGSLLTYAVSGQSGPLMGVMLLG